MNQPRTILLILFALFANSASVLANRLSFDYDSMPPFYTPKLNVQWAAPTNALPSTVRVFKVVPCAYSATTVSNLIALGGFRPSDRVKAFNPDYPLPKDAFGFQSTGGLRTLVYYPRQGRIDFSDEEAFAGPGRGIKVEGVPDETKIFDIALKILPKIGLSTNEMVSNSAGEVRRIFPTGSWGYFDKDRREDVMEIHRRGIGFTRSLDGIEVDWQRAAFMEFGNQGKLGKLDVHWCAVRPEGIYPVASPHQMVQWIKEGRTAVVSLQGPIGARWVRVADIRKLTITGVQPHYDLRYNFLNNDEPPEQVFPYALLTGQAEFGDNDHEQIYLYCPLIAEGLPKQHRPRDAQFSVYPSSRSPKPK